MIKEIDREEMERLIDEESAVLFDVREEEELEDGSIDGHVHLPLSSFEENQDQIPKNKPVIFYCRSGKRSMKCAEMAEELTDQPIYSLAGGYLAYSEEE
jgi:sulfur-carrier protein adenylyltransferase/sulfurtransferase